MRASSGMNVAVEWKDVLIESMKGAVILALLERFYVTKAASWFEDHIGACAVLDLHALQACAELPPRLAPAQTITAFRASCSAMRR